MKADQSLIAAFYAKDSDAFEVALSASFGTGEISEHGDLLVKALRESWHFRHEYVVTALQDLRFAKAVDALEWRAIHTPEYLGWDANFALARKCTWALADIGTRGAHDSLYRLSQCQNETVAGFAQKRLESWDDEIGRKGAKL